MLINILVLCGILYVGFKSFLKQQQIDKSKNSTETSVTKERLTKIFEESSNQNTQQGTSEHSSALTFKEQNNREIVSASIAMVLSSVGSWLYWPLGFLSIPFVIYASKQYHKETYELIKQGKVSVETLITITIVGVLFQVLFLLQASFLL